MTCLLNFYEISILDHYIIGCFCQVNEWKLSVLHNKEARVVPSNFIFCSYKNLPVVEY